MALVTTPEGRGERRFDPVTHMDLKYGLQWYDTREERDEALDRMLREKMRTARQTQLAAEVASEEARHEAAIAFLRRTSPGAVADEPAKPDKGTVAARFGTARPPGSRGDRPSQSRDGRRLRLLKDKVRRGLFPSIEAADKATRRVSVVP